MTHTPSNPIQERWQVLIDQLHVARERVPDIDWMAEWCVVRDLVSGIAWHDPLRDSLSDLVSECTRAYSYRDVIAFRNVVAKMERVKAKAFKEMEETV